MNRPLAYLSCLTLCVGLVACSSSVEPVSPMSPSSSGGDVASPAVASGSGSAAGALIYRINFMPQPPGSVDIYGRPCLSAAGSLVNTLTGESYYHLSGSAISASDQVAQVTASMEKTTGRVTGSISSAQAYLFGSFSGLAWGDQDTRTWSTTGGCAGFWSLTEGRSAEVSALPDSDVLTSSVWRVAVEAGSEHGPVGGHCGPAQGLLQIEAGRLRGELWDAAGQWIAVNARVDADGVIRQSDPSPVWRLEGRFAAEHAQGALSDDVGCRAVWQAERWSEP